MPRKLTLLLLCLLLTACYIVDDTPTPGAATSVPLPIATATPTADFTPIVAYFTGGTGENPADALTEAIDRAQNSVYIAIYNLSLDNITAALVHAHQRGVDVALVMESDNLQGPDEDQLMEAGIPIVGDEQNGLMHNKFAVIDGYEVWTGSMNFTDSGANDDANNLVRINSSRLAASYTAEFMAMFKDRKFGPGDDVVIPNAEVSVNGTLIRVFFSPHHAPGDALEELLRSAEDSIDILAFLWTSKPLANAILDEANDGVQVRGVFEADQVKGDANTRFPIFDEAGLDVRVDRDSGLMHNKVIIIDGKVVVVGSYNFSASADRTNDENLLILYSPQLAAEFEREFERLYALAAP